MGTTDSGLRQSELIEFSLLNPSVFIGEALTGKVILKIKNPLLFRDLILYLTIAEGWYQSTYDSNNNPKLNEELNTGSLFQIPINIRQFLNQNTELLSIQPGTYPIPFTMYTYNIPFPSVEFPKYGIRGYVRYILTSELVGCNTNKPEITDAFLHIKAVPLILNTPLTSFSEVTVYKWGLMGKGKTSLNCSIPKNTFCINENIPIAATVDNSKGDMDVTSVKISIHRIVHLIPSKQTVHLDYDESINSKDFKCNVPKGSTQNLSFSITLREEGISRYSVSGKPEPLTSQDDINLYIPTCLANLIKIEYNVKATAYFESMTGADSRPRCILPISVGHAGDFMPQQQMQQQYQQQTNPMEQQYQQQTNPMQQQYQQQPNPMQQQYQQQTNPMQQQYQQAPNPMEQQYQQAPNPMQQQYPSFQ